MRFPARPGAGPVLPAAVLAQAGLPRGEKVLAHAVTRDGRRVLGTRRWLVLVAEEVRRVPWEQVEDATWDQEESRLRVAELADFGTVRPVHDLVMDEPALLLQLVRERVTASVVLQRRVQVHGKVGLTVVGRRSPVGGPVRWMHAYDAGLDPTDPGVAAAAERALAEARAELGEVSQHPI